MVSAESAPAIPTPTITQTQAFEEVVTRANQGNERCLAGLRDTLDNHPEIWQMIGNVSARAERSWITLLSNDVLVRESTLRQLKSLKADLQGNRSTPLENLLIDLIGTTRLAAQHGEIEAASPTGGSLQQAAFRLRRAESAQKRFMRSVKTLALVRALVPRDTLRLASTGEGVRNEKVLG